MKIMTMVEAVNSVCGLARFVVEYLRLTVLVKQELRWQQSPGSAQGSIVDGWARNNGEAPFLREVGEGG